MERGITARNWPCACKTRRTAPQMKPSGREALSKCRVGREESDNRHESFCAGSPSRASGMLGGSRPPQALARDAPPPLGTPVKHAPYMYLYCILKCTCIREHMFIRICISKCICVLEQMPMRLLRVSAHTCVHVCALMYAYAYLLRVCQRMCMYAFMHPCMHK